MFRRFATIAFIWFALASSALATNKLHRVAIQVDQNDPQVMDLALNNATNVIEYYRDKNEDVEIDVVTYGPGLHMLRSDTSPVQDRIKRPKNIVFPGKIQFSACDNTKQGMEKDRGTCDFGRARRHGRTVRRGASDGIAGAGLELRPALREQDSFDIAALRRRRLFEQASIME